MHTFYLKPKEEELATLDKILTDYVGGAGKYQLFNSIVMAWVYYAGLYALFVTNFAAFEPPHRCWVDQCENLDFANQVTGKFPFFDKKSIVLSAHLKNDGVILSFNF